MLRSPFVLAVAVLATLATGCSPQQNDVERHLARGRLGRAARAARRIDDPGLRVASEALVSDALLDALTGDVRVVVRSPEELASTLGIHPPVFRSGDALAVDLDVAVERAARPPMSFRVLSIAYGGKRYLRTADCPPAGAVDLDCAGWLDGEPLVPRCESAPRGDGERAAIGVVRWISGGLVNAPVPRSDAPPCTRRPPARTDDAQASLDGAVARLRELLAAVPPRVSEGGRYERVELLHAASEVADDARYVAIQVAFHADRRGGRPLRRVLRVALPEAPSVVEALRARFPEAVPLESLPRAATPAPAAASDVAMGWGEEAAPEHRDHLVDLAPAIDRGRLDRPVEGHPAE